MPSGEFVSTPAEDTAEGRLLLNVSGGLAEFEREKIRDRTIRGRHEKARQGLYVMPHAAPFGYQADPARPGHLMLHEGGSETIRLIYRLACDERRSVRGIVGELRRLGLRAARGAWSCRQVRRVLTEATYAGTAYHDRKQTLPTGQTRERAASEWIALPIPALVTPERQATAQAQLRENQRRLVGRPASVPYLLKSLIRCSTCRRPFCRQALGQPPPLPARGSGRPVRAPDVVARRRAGGAGACVAHRGLGRSRGPASQR